MVFSGVCCDNSLIRRRRGSDLGYRQLYILPPIFETQFDCCLRFDFCLISIKVCNFFSLCLLVEVKRNNDLLSLHSFIDIK
jgi:hypothetical protein